MRQQHARLARSSRVAIGGVGGHLFVARVAGNVLTTEIIASLEYSVAVLGVKAVLVLGHTGCGAVKAAMKSDTVPGQISSLYRELRPAVEKSGGDLAKAIDAKFSSLDSFKEQFTKAATTVFGSGWAWLSVEKGGGLIVESLPNQDSPYSQGRTPILGLDVWEHAYYLKYQNRRKDYVDAIFNVVDWPAIQERFKTAGR